MAQHNPTLSDIAVQAGVSKSTVSMALRNHPRISSKQRQRIQKIAMDMGYRQNALLGQLMHELRHSHQQKFKASLAFVNLSKNENKRKKISTVDDWLKGAEAHAYNLGYSPDHFWIGEPGLRPSRLANIFHSRNIQGVIFYENEDENILLNCAPIWEQFASVVVGNRPTNPPLHFIACDHYSTAYRGCEKLYALGYRRIGTFTDKQLYVVLERRFIAGYLAFQDDKDDPLPVLYLKGDPTSVGCDQLTKQREFIQWYNKHRPDVILCNDSFVFPWLKSLRQAVPGDVGVTLMDLSREMQGNIAGMRQRHTWIGVACIDAIIGQIHRREIGVPPFQKGTLIESTWSDGPTVCSQL